ncbi:DUF3006 domain-containing protein [Paludicola sp. MB14-C6]|uniref:DUF3006 domain-containing protein n=1 Tax=Paludihabitans sp. MB14-C6 TaxID=3070656 RepID=UPI0027DC0385|nr:DUF3006 domain-containing protein [Paludicola sp. MB14-C6]WMJ24344.1 DUF3006 domain-containing protein [Paludicola sp. MB14-C6]
MQVIIDRFEGNFAIVELDNKTTVDMPKCLLPDDALEGDVIIIEIDKGETAKRLANIKKLEQLLWED